MALKLIEGQRQFEDRAEFAQYLARLPTEEKIEFKTRAEQDLPFFLRQVLWFDESLVLEADGSGAVRRGPEYGISMLGPHKKMIELWQSPTRFKHLEFPRNGYKSTFATGVCVQFLLVNPNGRILYCMATKVEARKKAGAVRGWFEDPVIELIWGVRLIDPKTKAPMAEAVNPATGAIEFHRTCKGPIWGREEFTIAMRNKVLMDPSFQIGGPEVNKVGAHVDLIVSDDCVTTELCRTDAGREAMDTFEAELEPILEPGGIRLDIGTRKAEGDPHSKKLYGAGSESWHSVVLSCGMELVFADGKPELIGKSAFSHLSEDFLRSTMQRQIANGKLDMFVMDYMNEVMPTGARRFKREDFLVMPWGDWMQDCPAYMLTDFATSASSDRDFCVVAIVLLDSQRRAYLLDMWLGRGDPGNIPHAVCSLWEAWSHRVRLVKMLLENVMVSQAFRPAIVAETRRRQMTIPIEMVSRGGGSESSKHARIQRLIPRFSNHEFFVVRSEWKGEVWFYDNAGPEVLWDPTGSTHERGSVPQPGGELVEQFESYPRGRHDDIPDSIADIDAVDENGQWICHGGGNRYSAGGGFPGPGRSYRRKGEQMVEVHHARRPTKITDLFGL